jgi:hypothetical protein
MRKRLSDAERELRRKQNLQKLKKGYGTYEGERGSPEQWQAMAERVRARVSGVAKALKVLGLDVIPKDLESLKRHYRRAMLTAHPDQGGSNEQAQRLNAAFEVVEKFLYNSQKE